MRLMEFMAKLMPCVCRRDPKQRTFVYCPKCNTELCSTGELLGDTDLVRYRCIVCGHRSGWNFDMPAPVLIEGHL